MRVLFFGMGSIGARHAALLSGRPDLELFAHRTHRGGQPTPAGMQAVLTWKEIEALRPDVAFITNPTFLHVETALACTRQGMRLFIEKPIGCSTAGLDVLLQEVEDRGLVTYVAYNLRFHSVIRELRRLLECRRVLHVSVYAASYLPRWRPGRDHRTSYSASRAQGGGVVLDLSHEFDYIDYLVGPIQRIQGVVGRTGCVTVDAEDYLDGLVETARCPVLVHLDFISQHSQRTIRVDCPEECFVADLLRGSIELHAGGEKTESVHSSGTDQTYRDQMDYFFENVNNPRMMNNLRDASVLFRKILDFRDHAL